MKVRLHDFYQGAVRKVCQCSLEGGRGYTNKSYEFEPDTDYYFEDPVIISYFKGEVGEVREHFVATPEIIAQLKAYNIPYTIEKCNSCPTAKPQVWFNPFVIEEEEHDNIVQE